MDAPAKVVLRVEDHANTDYSDIKHRAPIIATGPATSFESAVKRARKLQLERERGHNLVCLIYTYQEGYVGERPEVFSVSSNGRVWQGRDWKPGALEIAV